MLAKVLTLQDQEDCGLLKAEVTWTFKGAPRGRDTSLPGVTRTEILIAEQVGVTYQKLIDQGVSAEAALRAITPSLQRIWELQQKFGWSVDDATQALSIRARRRGSSAST